MLLKPRPGLGDGRVDGAAQGDARDHPRVDKDHVRGGQRVPPLRKPLLDGRALVGLTIRTHHGVGHDLLGDGADEVRRWLVSVPCGGFGSRRRSVVGGGTLRYLRPLPTIDQASKLFLLLLISI